MCQYVGFVHSDQFHGCSSRYCIVAIRNLRLGTTCRGLRGLRVVGSKYPTCRGQSTQSRHIRGAVCAEHILKHPAEEVGELNRSQLQAPLSCADHDVKNTMLRRPHLG